MTTNVGLEKAREARISAKNAGIPVKQLNPVERAAKDPKSLRKAINGKCWDCVYDPLAGGTWLDQVNNCTATDCPLWPVRPTKQSPNHD